MSSPETVLAAIGRAVKNAEEAGVPTRNLDVDEVALVAAMVVGEILQDVIDMVKKERGL